MRAPNLLHELDSMTHDARMRRMVDLGRQSLGDTWIAEVLDRWERGGFYERLLALQSCYGSYDSARVIRATSSSSRMLRALAVRLVPLASDVEQALAAFDNLPPTQRRSLLTALRRRGRGAAVDEILRVLASRDDPDLPRFIAFGTTAAVRQYLDQARDTMAARDWRSLAHAHPDLAADVLLRMAEGTADADPRLRWQANAALPELAELAPDRALALVDVLLRHIPLAELNLQRLAERRPIEVANMILGQQDQSRVDLSSVAHRLPTEQLIALVGHSSGALSEYGIWYGHTGPLPRWGRWFKRLAPAQRRAIYLAYEMGWRDGDGIVPTAVVALLPRDLRETEGQRHLSLPALTARPIQRVAYAAFVPWDEARTVLGPELRNPDAELRSAALAALTQATRYHRDRVGELLDIMAGRRNEQDPVRHVMLAGLADLPPGMWQVEHLDSLGNVLRAALDAADLSHGSASAAERLVVALVPFHPEWSSNWLATIVRERGGITFGNLSERLTDDDVDRLAPTLLPVLRAWQTREREQQLVNAARSFGRRLRVFEGVLELLERTIRTTRSAWIADQALALIAEHRPDQLATLVPDLVGTATGSARLVASRMPLLHGGDPSWITRPAVHTFLHRKRQDLLTPFLGQRAYSGRFSTGKTRFVLPLFDGFHRWTANQQMTFAVTLNELAAEEDRESPTVFATIQKLAALPGVPPDRLAALARDERAAVRDTALRALGQLDDVEQAMPTLLDALNDERARVAIYALRRALMTMPSERALALLRQASMERITVAKEVVRLIGELRTEEAYQELATLEARDLHRDMRVALLRALWSYVERDEPWQMFERAARMDDPAFARSLVNIPAERMSETAQRQLIRLLALLMEHPVATVRIDALRRCVALPVHDTERLLLAPLLRAMSSAIRDESAVAASAVFQTYSGREANVVATAVGQLTHDRRTLWTAVQALLGAIPWQRSMLLPTVRAVLETLGTDPLTANLRIELGARALPWPELAELLKALAATGDLHADAVPAFQHASARLDAAALAALEASLAASAEPILRRFGLATLMNMTQPPHGWDRTRVDRLHAYRNDPSPLVAATAQFTFPPDDAV